MWQLTISLSAFWLGLAIGEGLTNVGKGLASIAESIDKLYKNK